MVATRIRIKDIVLTANTVDYGSREQPVFLIYFQSYMYPHVWPLDHATMYSDQATTPLAHKPCQKQRELLTKGFSLATRKPREEAGESVACQASCSITGRRDKRETVRHDSMPGCLITRKKKQERSFVVIIIHLGVII